MSSERLTRRQALGRVARAAGAPFGSQASGRGDVPAVVPRADLVNVLEYDAQAARVLPPGVHARIAGGSRAAFDRMTLRPRVMVPATQLDLSVNLFGDTHFAPIVVAPVAHQRAFHPDGEAATMKGASAARAACVVSSRASVDLAALIAVSTTPVWYQVFASEPNAPDSAARAAAAGCRAVCVTVGASLGASASVAVPTSVGREWAAVAAISRAVSVPVMVKGVSTADVARVALQHDVHGLVVSNYGGLVGPGREALVLTLPSIVSAVGGRVPVLIDGGFRRGTDVLKALAFGASAVLVGRPVMWGLAAYGADGVQGVLEMLQTELGRYMAMTGAPSLGLVTGAMARVHQA